MRNVKIGAPGYILLKEIGKDMPGTLKRVADLGFDGFEITGFYGHEAGKIRDWCREAGIEPYGCFAGLDELAGMQDTRGGSSNWNEFRRAFNIPGETPEEKIAYIREIGCTYVGLLVPNSTMDGAVTERMNRVSAAVRAQGMKLQYHNHDYEFNNMVNGQYRMDFILENTVPEILFEPDLGWMEIGGCRCERFLSQYADRIEVVHLKDYYRAAFDTSLEYRFRPTGYGVMDWARILPLCEEKIRPQWYTADHDSAYGGDIYRELGMSLAFIRNALEYCREEE